jgi:hypothetical protein
MTTSIAEFELRKQLSEAFKSGRYFITVTVFDPYSKKLSHYYSQKDFPTDDLIPSLSHIAGVIDEKVAPIATSKPGRHPDDDPGGSGSEADVS